MRPTCAPPTTGWRPIWATGPGRRRAHSRWPIAPRRRRYSMPTGSRRSARTGRGLPPIARGCWPIRSWPARSTRAGPTAPSSRWARPTATDQGLAHRARNAPDAAMPKHHLLRDSREQADHSVSPLELFFDLVFVFAVTQLSHYLLAHHSPGRGAADDCHVPRRLVGVDVHRLGDQLARSRPDAGPPRAADRHAAQHGHVELDTGGVRRLRPWLRPGLCRDPGRPDLLHRLGREGFPGRFARPTWPGPRSISPCPAPLWIAGGLDPDPLRRLLWWAAALAIEYSGPFTFFWVPGIGRSRPEDWQISGAHMAERAGLFIIIALGESIIVTGATFAELEPSSGRRRSPSSAPSLARSPCGGSISTSARGAAAS